MNDGDGTAGHGRPENLRKRTRQFALTVIGLTSELPKTETGRVIGRQLLRSGTSAGAHYREGTRARSTAEFVSKMEGGLQELEESMYWMELILEAGLLPEDRVRPLLSESSELAAIFVTCVKNAKARRSNPAD